MCLSDFSIFLEFKHNLLFASKITLSNLAKNDKCKVHFYDGYCVIQDNVTQKIRGLGESKDALYYLLDGKINVTIKTLSEISRQFSTVQSLK